MIRAVRKRGVLEAGILPAKALVLGTKAGGADQAEGKQAELHIVILRSKLERENQAYASERRKRKPHPKRIRL